MLLKSNISGLVAGSEEWLTARLAKFTSSQIFQICAPEGFGIQGMNYIYSRVGEESTGKTSDKELDYLPSIRHGVLYEYEGLQKLGKKMGWNYMVTHQLITEPNSRFGSSPDGLIPIRESPDGLSYEVYNVEIKCPETYAEYIKLFLCETPEQLKKVSPKYFWQTVDQGDHVDALKSYFGCFHPDFRFGNCNCIEFDYMKPHVDAKGKTTFPLYEERKFLRIRKKQAEEKLYEIRDKLIKAGKV